LSLFQPFGVTINQLKKYPHDPEKSGFRGKSLSAENVAENFFTFFETISFYDRPGTFSDGANGKAAKNVSLFSFLSVAKQV